MKKRNDSKVAGYLLPAAAAGLLLAATASAVKAYLNEVEVCYPLSKAKLVPNRSPADGARVTACGLKLNRHAAANDACYAKQADGSWALVAPQINVGGAL